MNPKAPTRQGFVAPLALLLLLIAGWEVGALLYQHYSTPTTQHWRMAVDRLSVLRKNQDEPILVAPGWVAPLARYHLGALSTLELATLPHVETAATIWQLSIRGKQHPWLQSMKPQEQWIFGKVTLSRFVQQPARTTFNFSRELMQAAHVEVLGDNARPCPLTGDHFVCDPSSASWQWVGPHLAEVGFQPYRCIHAHPIAGATLQISFDNVPLGHKLVTFTGIDDNQSRRLADGIVTLETHIGDKRVGQVEHQNDWPWHREEADTTAFKGTTMPVRFLIRSDKTFRRTFCFHAEARE